MLPLTPEDALRIDNNPDLLHVGIMDGKLWLSDDARDDIRGLTGLCPEIECPERMLAFLGGECRRLQALDEQVDAEDAERNFLAFCALKGLEHAIASKLLGHAHVGAFRPDRLVAAFFSAPAVTWLH